MEKNTEKLSKEVYVIVEQSLNNMGIKGFNAINQTKTPIATMKSDLKALMSTLERNVC